MTIEIETDEYGTIRHLKDGKRHREDGPAVIWADGEMGWFQNDRLHRADGPALIWPDGSLEWYLDGKECTFNEWCKKANITDQQKTLLLMKYS